MNKRTIIITWLLALLPLAAVAVLYGRLPGRIPTHWDINGTVTYGSKSTIWMVAGLSPLMTVLFGVLPKIDPRRKNYAKFQEYYDGFRIVMLLFLLVLTGVILSESLSPGHISVGRVISICVGILFVYIGNILPKIKNNFFMGIKTPWTLSDPDVWNRSNRLGGRLFFWFGLAFAVGGLFLPETANFVILMIGVVAISALPTLMSYVWYRQKSSDKEE
ncbi:Immunity protein SdpI [bioreactor metagenome]|uniref:Immunity protein SdpI n=1 Tax=bioreactor metagenome TaxID=1076179 RepID=A0A644YCI6_9ZZZZ